MYSAPLLPPYPEMVRPGSRSGQPGCGDRGLPGAPGRPDDQGGGRGQDPATGGCDLDNLRWLLARNGPMAVFDVAAHAGASVKTVRRGLLQAAAGLFPHLDVTAAYVLLFSVYSGIVPEGIDDLTTGDIDWAGDASVLLSYVKRRTAAESLTLPRRAVRLLEQWLDHPGCCGALFSRPAGTSSGWGSGSAVMPPSPRGRSTVT